MLNQTILVGRLVRKPEVKELENGNRVSNITLAIPRSYKNSNGEYETDFVDCSLWKGMAEKTAEYCKKGDIIGVRGRIETKSYEQDGTKKYKTNIIAERVTFLSSAKEKTDDKEMEI